MQMRYCLKWQNNINSFHAVFLSVLGAALEPQMFLSFYTTAMVLRECSACGLLWKLCSLVGFMSPVGWLCLLPICRFIRPLKPIMFLPSKVYDIQGNLQDGSQVVVSVIFENKCDSFLKSMEFNVLDSLNSKLQRPEGSGPHDGLTVPFQLPPGRWFGKCWPLWMCSFQTCRPLHYVFFYCVLILSHFKLVNPGIEYKSNSLSQLEMFMVAALFFKLD